MKTTWKRSCRMALSAGILFLLSFQSVYVPHYKTLNDSTFETGDIIRIPAVMYNLGRCELRKDSILHPEDSLKVVAGFLKMHANLVVEIDVHTDYVNPASSQKLTYCRARSCYEELLSLGIDTARLSYHGYGDSRPPVLDKDIVLPSGKTVKQGAVLTKKFRDQYVSDKNDYEFLNQLCRRTELKVIRTDYMK